MRRWGCIYLRFLGGGSPTFEGVHWLFLPVVGQHEPVIYIHCCFSYKRSEGVGGGWGGRGLEGVIVCVREGVIV